MTEQKENFNERRSRWERTAEDVLIEITQEKSDNGLLIEADGVSDVIKSVNTLIDNCQKAKEFANANPGIAKITPGNKFNEE